MKRFKCLLLEKNTLGRPTRIRFSNCSMRIFGGQVGGQRDTPFIPTNNVDPIFLDIGVASLKVNIRSINPHNSA